MKPIDITGKQVRVIKGAIELRTAAKGCAGWPYHSWMLRPRDDGKPGFVYLHMEKGEILSQTALNQGYDVKGRYCHNRRSSSKSAQDCFP